MPRFSQRNGFKEPPSQLPLGKVSNEFRARLMLAFERLMGRGFRESGMYGYYLSRLGERFFQDLWVKEMRKTGSIDYEYEKLITLVTDTLDRKDFNEVFDLIEFAVEFSGDHNFLIEISQAFIDERLAYRFKDGEVIAVGTQEQADTIGRAFDRLDETDDQSASVHLQSAARLLAQGEFAGSARESISAVESVARKIEPTAQSLGAALNMIEKNKTVEIHPALKGAFQKLYGYTSDEEGIRHPLIDMPEAPVTEADALFILGACAAFIPYLLSNS